MNSNVPDNPTLTFLERLNCSSPRVLLLGCQFHFQGLSATSFQWLWSLITVAAPQPSQVWLTRHTILALCLHLKFPTGGELRQGPEKLLEDLLFWEASSWRRYASVKSWTFLYLTEVGGSLLSSCLGFSLIIPGTSQAPGLFGFLRREAPLLPGSCQKNCTQKMAVSSCLGPQTYIMLYKQSETSLALKFTYVTRKQGFLIAFFLGGKSLPSTPTPSGQIVSWLKSLPLK